jgi:hypothetical protein
MRRAMRIRAITAYFGRGPFAQLAVVWTPPTGRCDNCHLVCREPTGQWWEPSKQRGWVPIESPFRAPQPLPLPADPNPPVIDPDPALDPEERWNLDTGDDGMWGAVPTECDEFDPVSNPAFDGDGFGSDSYSPVCGGGAQIS